MPDARFWLKFTVTVKAELETKHAKLAFERKKTHVDGFYHDTKQALIPCAKYTDALLAKKKK